MAQLIKTPHPVTLEGQERIAVTLLPGESLFALLNRTLGDQLDGELWNVSVAGMEIPREAWHDCYPRDGQTIECVGDLGRGALMMVATIALTIWTGGLASTVAAGGGILGMGAVASYAVIAGIQVAGSLLINKVLGPKAPGSPDSTQGPQAFSLNSTQNQLRPYGAPGLLFGRLRYAPDLISQPYSYFDRDDMFMAMHLGWGIGVGRVSELRNGDTDLADYDDAVQQWNSGFLNMTNEVIPLFGNTDTQPGGSLQQDETLLDVIRTTSVETVRVMVNISGTLHGVTRKGKLSYNQESFTMYWRKAGQVAWEGQQVRAISNNDRRTVRFTMIQDLPEGQYDIRVRRMGRQSTGDNDQCEFSFDTLVSVQKDESTYRGLARTGFTLRANERLASQPTAVNGFAIAAPIPVWNGTQWVNEETSNPGAHMLKYLRGYYDQNGNIIAGVGWDDADIDIEAYKAFMVHCARMGFTYDYWLNTERDHLEVLNSIAQAAMAQYSDANGLHSVSWVAEDQPIDGTVNMARVKRGTFRVDYSLVATADGVEVRYWDTSLNKEALLRVPMPGVETMLSPAKLDLEGVTSEAQAAFLARYYLAQSLYQFKDISYGTGLENLTYRRLSLLQMQHDLTQWGYGGTVLEAEPVGNRIQFTLDEPIPPPPNGAAWIGIRVPGQRACAVFRVQAFTEPTNVVTLAEPWPSDLPLPGNSGDNPAQNSIWIYDFKETPGLTVRVVNIARAADRSANVSVVVENQEFWTYVRTGVYIPAESGSLLQTRPVISDMVVTDQQLVLGDVIQDQLVVSFQVSGPYDETVIYTTESDGTLRERARTHSRNAEFNIPGPGVYTVTTVPFNRQGLRGTGQTVTYATRNSGVPPVLVDNFDVEDGLGGVRRYVWGFNPQTTQSADFAGVEIRYTAGNVPDAVWEDMLPVGEGFFVSSQELVVPPAGTWTFACRSRNTSGVLSVDRRVVVRQLAANLPEVISGIEQGGNDNAASIEQEINDRIDGDLQTANDAAAALAAAAARQDAALQEVVADVTAAEQEISDNAAAITENVQKLEQEIQDRVAADLNTRTQLTTLITTETQQRVAADETFARQISEIAAGSGEQFDSKKMWYFDTTVEGWTSNGGTPTIVDGWMRPFNNANAFVTSPTGLAVDGAAYRFLMLRLRKVGAPVWKGTVQWITDADTTYNAAKSATIPEPSYDAQGITTLKLDNIPWNGASPIRQIRLDLTVAQTATAYILYDWVAIGRPTPGASIALVQEEATARIAADSAEASARQTLAVQMRGDYTGTDANAPALTTGLIASEKSLRINGDQVNATAIQAINVRLPDGSGKVASESSVTILQAAMVAGDAANAQSITNLASTLNNIGGDNQVGNSSFEAAPGNLGWTSNNASVAGGVVTRSFVDSTLPNSTKAFRWDIANMPATGSTEITSNSAVQPVRVEAGKKHTVSCYVRGTVGPRMFMQLAWRDASGAILGYTGTSNIPAYQMGSESWERKVWTTPGVAPATAVTATVYVRVYGAGIPGQWFEVDNVQVQVGEVATGYMPSAAEMVTGQAATAAALGALTTEVSNVKGTVNAQAQQITQLNTRVDGKAEATALQALSTTVTNQGDTITSQGTAITGLQNALPGKADVSALNALGTRVTDAEGNIAAVAQSVTTLTANTGAMLGDNLLPNASFDGYLLATDYPTGYIYSASTAFTMSYVDSTLAGSTKALRMYRASAPANSYIGIEPALHLRAKAVPGQKYTASVYAYGAVGQQMAIFLQFINASGGVVGATTQTMFTLTAEVARYSMTSNLAAGAPASAVAVRVGWRGYAGSVAGPVDLTIDNVQLQVGEVATAWAPGIAGLSSQAAATSVATAALTATVTQQGSDIQAQSQSITSLNNKMTATLPTGANIARNPNFALGPDFWIAAGTPAPAWSATAGDGRPGFTLTKSGSANPQIGMNDNQPYLLQPRAGRRMRAVVRAMATTAGVSMMLRLIRRNYLTGVEANNDKQQVLTTSFASYSIDFDALDATTGSIRLALFCFPTNGTIRVDSVELYDITDMLASEANASALSSLTTTVSTQGTTLTAQGTQITQLTTRVDGKADSTALQGLQSTVSTQGETINSQGQAITQLTSTVNGKADAIAVNSLSTTVTQQGQTLSAQATSIQGLQVQMNGKAEASVVQTMDVQVKNQGSGGNLLSNSTFPLWQSNGWVWLNANGFGGLGNTTGDTNFIPQGMNSALAAFRPGTFATTQDAYLATDYTMPATAGSNYCISAYINTHRCSANIYVEFLNGVGQAIGQVASPAATNTGQTSGPIAGFTRPFAIGAAPAGTVAMRVVMRIVGTGAADAYWWMFRPMLSQVAAGATTPPTWSAGGAEASASWAVNVRADGRVGGIQLAATGQLASFDIFADILRISKPGGGARTEYSDGHWRVYDGNNVLRVRMGVGW